MNIGKKLGHFVSVSVALVWLVSAGMSLAQDAPVPGAAEPAKVEAPAAPAAEAKKEDPGAAPAQFTQGLLEQIGGAKVAADTMWTLIAAMLVFFMNLGFATVESGLCRAKNAVTILAKNFIVFAAASIAFLVLGWGLMFGDGNPFFGTQGLWFVGGADNSPAMGDAYKGVYSSINWTGVPLWTKFFFQLVFAGTAATIVSGAVAERIKFGSFYIFSFLMVGIIYPVVGHWIWGGGWAAKLGMFDFAGSTVVHSVGGWAALAGVMVLGPRIGKYSKEGKVRPIPGHSMTLATLGVFVLWFGWFGFNPGSTMAADAACYRSYCGSDQHCSSRSGNRGVNYGVASFRQARSVDDSQRRISGVGGDHGALRICQHSKFAGHWFNRWVFGCCFRALLRQNQSRRPRRGDIGSLGLWHLWNSRGRAFCSGGVYA